MNFEIIKAGEVHIAEVTASESQIKTVQDALNLIANADYQGARSVIIGADRFTEEFFDLKSGLAGEVLQKVSNYRFKLAIVGNFSTYKSNALQAFIIECNRGNHIFFTPDRKAAIEKILA